MVRTRGRHFVDEQGRTLWLRGANVGAASKTPSYAPFSLCSLFLAIARALPCRTSPRLTPLLSLLLAVHNRDETKLLPLDRHREVSYVDRPFPLDQADEHLARLRFWGFNLCTAPFSPFFPSAFFFVLHRLG
jgi:hypothetical protein